MSGDWRNIRATSSAHAREGGVQASRENLPVCHACFWIADALLPPARCDLQRTSRSAPEWPK
jgi:hypothetical protein